MKNFFDISIIWKKVNSKLTEKETDELQDWIGDKPERKDYAEKAYSYFKKGHKIKTEDINVTKAKRKVAFFVFVSPVIKKTFKVAAIFIGIVSVVFFLQLINKNNITSESIVKIEPGKAKATIVLSDGSRHYLDKENPRELNEKGAVILNSGNKLEYKTEPSSDISHLERLQTRYNTINIPRGGEFFLRLSDGTKVWMNSETTLTYPLQFGDTERKVELIGEACFEVEHNPEKPFKVEVAGQVIEVLGTTFNVNAYADESKTSTTLVEGSVKINLGGGQEDVLLKPGFQCEVNKADKSYLVSQVDIRKAIAWREGNYLFDDATLEEMILILSRWYDFTFNFENEDARQVHFNGKLKRTDKFEDILTIIENTNEVKFKVKERNVIIY